MVDLDVIGSVMCNKDSDIVDRWFQNVCRHVVMETWEQEEAMKKSMTV